MVWRVTSTTNTTQRVSVSRVDNSLGEEAIPFIKPTEINFVGERFRPYSKINVYFDGVDISSSVTPNGLSLGQTLIADSSGNFSGKFSIPPNTFRTGESVVGFSDDQNLAEATSVGATKFSSGGVLETKQATITNTSTTINTRIDVGQWDFTGWGEGGGGGGGDPLAQTFFVNTKTNSPGCFVTKIKTFFQSKDPRESIELELRTTENGYPGKEILGKKIVQSANVPISSDASLPTIFEFDCPVFLENGKEYCFVLKTNSTEYNAWVGTLGQARVDKKEAIAKQPNAGVMFVSANNSSWTAIQDSDVKFEISIAKFNTIGSTVSSVLEYPNSRTAFKTLISTTIGTRLIGVSAIGHGLEVGSSVKIKIEGSDGATEVGGIPISNVNGVRTVISKTDRGFIFQAGGSTNATLTGNVSVESISFTPNAVVDSVLPVINEIVLPGTNIGYSINLVSGKSIDGIQTPFIVDAESTRLVNKSICQFNSPKMLPSFPETSYRFGGLNKGKLGIVLSTSDPFVSPVVDLGGSGIVCYSNVLNNPSTLTLGSEFVSETSSGVGSSLMRYINKPVSLETPATSLKVIFAANCVTGNNISVFYRVAGSTESSNLSEKSWIELATNFKNSPDRNSLYDYSYEVSNLSEFNTFQIKIVGSGINTSIPPRIKDLRILALAV